ncbi:MAG: molybdenum cofactor guanylyltransferase [Caldilineales bacterium]
MSVMVLAGGDSRRMGTNKALLELPSGETLIERVLNTLRPLSDDLLIVSNTPDLYAHLDARQVSDEFAGAGPLAGLHAGLHAARHDWTFAVACDMPLVDHRLVRFMAVLTEGYDAIVPWVDGELEPLHALYNKRCLPAITGHLEAGHRRMIAFLGDVRVRRVEANEIALFDPEGRSFFNANTPEDWQRLQELVSEPARRRSTRKDS